MGLKHKHTGSKHVRESAGAARRVHANRCAKCRTNPHGCVWLLAGFVTQTKCDTDAALHSGLQACSPYSSGKPFPCKENQSHKNEHIL